MTFTYTTYSPEETQTIAKRLAQLIPAGSLMTLTGPLGAGKTTFAQGFGRALGVTRAISSPTYTIVKEYPLNREDGADADYFVHIDAYRLEDGDPSDIDLPQYLNDSHYILVEWSQFIAEVLPDSYLELQLTPLTEDSENFDTRELTLKVHGDDPMLKAAVQQLAEEYPVD